LHSFRDINTYFAKIKTLHDLHHIAYTSITICYHKTNTSRAKPCTKFDDSTFSHSGEI